MAGEEPPPPGPTGLPVLSGSGKTEDALWRYVLRHIGGGVTDVELTSRGDSDPVTGIPFPEGETHQDDCLEDTRRWFSYRVGFKKIVQLRLAAGQSAYLMPPDAIEVTEVWFPSFQLPTLDADQFSYTYFTLLFGQWTNPAVGPLPYSDLVHRLQYLEHIGRIFSSDRVWEFHAETRILEILPAPSRGGSLLSAAENNALVTIWSSHIDTRQLDPQDLDFFKRKLIIQALRVLGNIRSKYDSVPTTGGDRSMNGPDIIANADVMEEKLEVDVLNWKRPVAIITG